MSINDRFFRKNEVQYPRALDDRAAPGLTHDGLAPVSSIIHTEPLVPGMIALQRAREEALGTPTRGRWAVRWKSIQDGIVWDHGTKLWAGELDRRCARMRLQGGFQFSIAPADEAGVVGGTKYFDNDPRVPWRAYKPNEGDTDAGE